MTLSGEVECDEVYVVAGHKGQPGKVRALGRPRRRRRLKGARGRSTKATEKPPILGMIQRYPKSDDVTPQIAEAEYAVI